MLSLGFSITQPRAQGGADASATAPVIWLEGGGGYAGSVLRASRGGMWYVGGVAVSAGTHYTMRSQDEGLPIYMRTEPAIWLASGTGYAGSILQANHVGQWYANGVKIAGAVGLSLTITPALEGAEITQQIEPVIWADRGGTGYAGTVLRSNLPGTWYVNGIAAGSAGREYTIRQQDEGLPIWIDVTTDISEIEEYSMQSNTFQVFVPSQLASGLKTNGGHWAAETQQTVMRDGVEYVTAWTDRFGVRDMAQAAAANQPKLGTIAGHAAAIWDKSPAFQSLDAPTAFASKWWIILAQFGSGTETVTTAYTGGASIAYLLSRGGGQANAVNFSGSGVPGGNATEAGVRVNGASAEVMSNVLPLPLGALSWTLNTTNQADFAWSLGRGYDVNQDRQWVGPIVAAIALGEVPDTATRQKIEGYLHHKYSLAGNLPESHPYRHIAPAP